MSKIKLLLVGLLMSFSVLSFSQVEPNTVSVVNVVDEMSGESFLTPSRKLVISNDELTKGFSITVHFSPTFKPTLTSEMIGIGSCNEKDELIILLDDGEKINLISWKSFNCEGVGYFSLTNGMIKKLRNSPLSKIRITNGRSYDSYTKEVNDEDKNYFIQLFNSYYSGNYLTIKIK